MKLKDNSTVYYYNGDIPPLRGCPINWKVNNTVKCYCHENSCYSLKTTILKVITFSILVMVSIITCGYSLIYSVIICVDIFIWMDSLNDRRNIKLLKKNEKYKQLQEN